MKFFDNFAETVSSAGKDLAGKAKTLASVTSLKTQISTNKNSIAKKYREIGRLYYHAHKNDDTAEFHELVSDIKSFEKTNEELQSKINRMSGYTQCPNCHADVPKGSNYCLKCGVKIEDQYYDEEDTNVNEIEISSIISDDEDDNN